MLPFLWGFWVLAINCLLFLASSYTKVHEHAFLLGILKEPGKGEGFDKDNWPLTTHKELSNTYTYYGYRPYWQPAKTEQPARKNPKRKGLPGRKLERSGVE